MQQVEYRPLTQSTLGVVYDLRNQYGVNSGENGLSFWDNVRILVSGDEYLRFISPSCPQRAAFIALATVTLSKREIVLLAEIEDMSVNMRICISAHDT